MEAIGKPPSGTSIYIFENLCKPGNILFSMDNIKTIRNLGNTPALYNTSAALSILIEQNLLLMDQEGQVRFNAIINTLQPYSLSVVLSLMKQAGLVNRDNVDRLLRCSNLLAQRNFWHRLPVHALNADTFNHIMTCIEQNQNNPERIPIALENYMAQLLPAQPHGEVVAGGVANNDYNAPQNTHTASVHMSVSKSAERLSQRYAPQSPLELETTLDELSTWLNTDAIGECKDAKGEPDQERIAKHPAAVRALKRILEVSYVFQDPDSEISTRQLLGLIWRMLDDRETHYPNLPQNAGKMCLIDALYECQRGYNLNKKGIDDRQKDYPICAGGTFNKLLEKMTCIHPDVTVIFVNRNMATEQFPRIICEVAKEYLTQNSSILENTPSEELIEAIWDDIKEKVGDRLWSEFSMAYDGTKGKIVFDQTIKFGYQCEVNLNFVDELLSKKRPASPNNSYIESQKLFSPSSPDSSLKVSVEELGASPK